MKSFNELENVIPEPKMQNVKGITLDMVHSIDQSIYWSFITYKSLDKITSPNSSCPVKKIIGLSTSSFLIILATSIPDLVGASISNI